MKFMIYLLLTFIAVFPKISILSVSGGTSGIRFEDILVLIIGISILLKEVKGYRKKNDLVFIRVEKIFIIYFLFSVFSTIYGNICGYISGITSILYLLRKLEYFVLFYIGYYFYREIQGKEDRYLSIIVLIHAILCQLQMLGIINSFTAGGMVSGLTQGRVSSTFNGAYEMSAFLLLIVPFYIYKCIKKDEITKSVIFIILITTCIVVSQSRTSLVVEVVIAVLMLCKYKILKKESFVRALCLIVLFLSPALFFLFSKIDLTRFLNLSINKTIDIFRIAWKYRNFEEYVKFGNWYGDSPYSLTQMDYMGYDASSYQRFSHWVQLIEGWFKSPVLGCGASFAGNSADGNYIKILSESGIVGLVLWIYLLVIIYSFLRIKDSWILFSFISLLLGAIFIDLFDSSKVIMMFWFMFGVYLGRANDSKECNIN